MSNYNPDFDWWLIRATKNIKYRPDRQAVYQELYQHIEDRYLDFLEHGMNADEAEKKALCVMGDADEIAPQLAAIHRPFWGYVYSFCKLSFLVLSVITLLKSVPWLKSYYDDIQEPIIYTYGFANGTSPFEVLTNEELQHPWNCVFYSHPNCKASSDGYTFSIRNAALWHEQYDDSDLSAVRDHLYILMDITNPLPWVELTDVPNWFWAEDSSGNYYYSNNEYAQRKYAEDEYANPEPSLVGSIDKTGIFTYTYFIWIRGFDSEKSDWIELHYDKSGRDIVLRIDLTGGGTP